MDATHRTSTGSSRGWLGFALGLIVGLAVGGLVIAGTLAERRRARRALPWGRHRGRRSAPLAKDGNSDDWDNERMRAARRWPDDAELDEELDQTFPASDPLPYSHRVD